MEDVDESWGEAEHVLEKRRAIMDYEGQGLEKGLLVLKVEARLLENPARYWDVGL